MSFHYKSEDIYSSDEDINGVTPVQSTIMNTKYTNYDDESPIYSP